MNSDALFGMALGLQSPWKITGVTFETKDEARRELHLRIGFAAGRAVGWIRCRQSTTDDVMAVWRKPTGVPPHEANDWN